MKMTKHAYARFKQRQNVKNMGEMMRKFTLAVERGTLLVEGTNRPRTLCYLFGGFKYIVSEDKETLITVMRINKRPSATKRHLIDEIRMKQSRAEAILWFDNR